MASTSSQPDPEASTSAETLIDPLVCDRDDPKPGPSTSAADFDLEVFDSGSSCSMEEYLLDKKAKGKAKSKKPPAVVPTSSTSTVSEHPEDCDVQTTGSKFEEPVSCVSEASEGEDDSDRSKAIDFIQMLPPTDVRSTVENWRCDNTDEIVQDHDNFGTDENEDSMDYPNDIALPSSATTPPQSLPPPPSAQDESTQSSFELDPPDMDWSGTHKRKSQLVESSDDDDVPVKKPCIVRRPLYVDGDSKCKLIPDKDNPPREILDWVSTFARWSHAQRLLALDQLIDTCEPTQVRHMMQVIEPQFQRDFISLLPKELALFVLSYLDPKDLLRAAQTCRYWRILAEDNLLWREKCREAGVDDVQDVLRRRRSSGFHYSTWKASYMRQQNILMNWRVRPIRSPKVLKGHDDHVITCLQFNGQRIVSGSDDNTLKVWSALTGKCLRTLVGHTGGVWSSQMDGNVIVSGSTDRTLKVWDAETGQCVHTLYGHTSTVRCMHLHGKRVVSGSRDATLRMWDIESGECLHVLSGHVAAVRCVQYDGRLVVSGAYDYMVKVWNPEKEECLHTLSGHTNRVYSLQFDGIHVVSGSLDTSIRVWDVESGACKHALMGHQSLTSGMELRNNILVSGNADSTVKVWDITTGQCLQTLSGINKHQSAVTCLQFNSNFVITSSDDGTVKLWDVKTGEFLRDLVALDSGGSGGVVWRIRANSTKLVCAVGSRNGTEETKLLVLDFDAEIN